MPLDHERLIVYQRALQFIEWSAVLLKELGSVGDVRSQLDRASTSVPLNIAEGNGKFSIRDRIKYLDIAYGSALESSACLDVIKSKSAADSERLSPGKRLTEEMVNRLVRLRAAVASRDQGSLHEWRAREDGADEWFSFSDLEKA